MSKETIWIPIAPCVVQRLNYFIQTKRIPHLLFHGNSGTGKRTIVNYFIREILQNDTKRIENNVLYVNCAHEKGIQFIRCEIKNFARMNVQYVSHAQSDKVNTKNKNEMFKIIVLQNADKLTIDAQSALRRSIEIYSHNTRFFIIVENIQKILNPILSRFCEIYVPDRMDTQGNIVCLHQLSHYIQPNVSPVLSQAHTSVYQTQLETFLKNSDPAFALMISNQMYENGLSAYELMELLKPLISMKSYSHLDIEFQKVKSEFRCEKLLFLYLLIFLTSI